MRSIAIGIGFAMLLSVAQAHAAGSELTNAVKNGDRALVRSLLARHSDVNAPEADGATPLAWAAQRNDLETAEVLIRAGASVSAANDNGATPLWIAASKGSATMADLLLKAGADANARLTAGETTLMTAVNTGNLNLVKSLLAHGANVNAAETVGGQTALMWAVSEGHPEVAQALVEAGANINARSKRGFTPLLFAAQRGDVESARILATGGADINIATLDGRSPLLIASAGEYEDLSIFLLSQGANSSAADRTGFTAMYYAAAGGQLKLVKALLDKGVNPNSQLARERTNSGPQATVDYPPVSLIGATPILLAAEAGNAEVVRLLAANGADPQLATKEKSTPLLVAAGAGVYQDLANDLLQEDWEKRHLETAKVLLDLGVDVNAAGENGWTALHAAAYMGLDELIPLLVKKGARMEAMDDFGQTPLSIAEGVITVGLGNAANRRPRNVRRDTADILLKLGATPVAASGVQVLLKKGTQ